MGNHVPAPLRRLVAERASGLCEYCLIHEEDTYFGCEVEHVIAQKHGGNTSAENLAYVCVFCNRYKGTDIASLSATTGKLSRLFHPRTDRWSDHFTLEANGRIRPLTEIGEVTAQILGINDEERLIERSALRDVGRYPTPAAQARISPP